MCELPWTSWTQHTRDLHLEHLNRVLKTAIKGLGANKTNKGIVRVGKCIGVISHLLDTFDKHTDIAQNSSTHKVLSFEKDRDKVLRELVDTSVFQEIGYRQHNSFQNFKTNQMRNLNKKKFDEWMLKRLRIIKYGF